MHWLQSYDFSQKSLRICKSLFIEQGIEGDPLLIRNKIAHDCYVKTIFARLMIAEIKLAMDQYAYLFPTLGLTNVFVVTINCYWVNTGFI